MDRAICLICWGSSGDGYAACFACRIVASRLHLPLAPVLPMHRCTVDDPLYGDLIAYKESPVADLRRRASARVVGRMAAFLSEHGPCVASALGGEPQLVLTVPSTHRRDRSPLARLAGLEAAITTAFPVADWMPHALVRTSVPVGHMEPHAEACAVDPTVGLGSVDRALVLDDTYVSGARSQSAAAALRLAGVRSVLIAPLVRLIRPERSAAHASLAQNGAAGCAHCVCGQAMAGTE
jgi:hypothetical protein